MRYITIFILLLLFAGCQYPFEFLTEKEIREKVLGSDPSFGSLLDTKVKLDEEARVIGQDFNAKKEEINGKILVLREELKSAKNGVANKIKEIDSRLEPDREELRQKIQELTAELKLKEASLYATNKMIARLNKLLQKGPTSENLAKEAQNWQDKIASLKTQAEELEKDVSSIRDAIRISRLKLKLLTIT